MTSKYQGLPDIQDTAPDVFETPDEPEPALRPSEGIYGDDDDTPKPQSEMIDPTGLPTLHKAEKIFGRGSRKTNPSFDFRPRLPPFRRYRSDSSSSDESPRETPTARIRRLKAELEEVEREVRAESSRRPRVAKGENVEGKRKSVLPPREPIDLVSELAGLRERINAVTVGDEREVAIAPLDLRERLEKVTQRPPTVTVASVGHGDAEDEETKSSPAGLSEIDKRLAALEHLIGPSDPAFEASSSLMSTLNKHDHLLTLLTQPRQLDAISRRVKLLLVDLDRAAAAARRQTSSTNAQSSDKTITLSTTDCAALQSLITLLPRLDPLLPIVPPLLARLRSLSTLHAAASNVADNLARLKENDKKGGEEVDELKAMVESLQRGMDEAGKTILSNWEGVEERMNDIEKRIVKLNQ